MLPGHHKPKNVIKAQQALMKLSHLEATEIQDLVSADVDAFATKYLSAISPDTMTQTQLDAMVSLGQDVYNTSLCTHIQQASTETALFASAPIASAQIASAPIASRTEVAMPKRKSQTLTHESPLDKKYTMRELQPKLERAVTETLHAYGIHDQEDGDTKQLARMHQLESLLRT